MCYWIAFEGSVAPTYRLYVNKQQWDLWTGYKGCQPWGHSDLFSILESTLDNPGEYLKWRYGS